MFHLLHLMSPVQITKPSSNAIFTSPHLGSRTCCFFIGYLTLTLNVRSKRFSSVLGAKAGVDLYLCQLCGHRPLQLSQKGHAHLCALPYSDNSSILECVLVFLETPSGREARSLARERVQGLRFSPLEARCSSW